MTNTYDELLQARRDKLNVARQGMAFPNDFKTNITIDQFINLFKDATKEDLDQLAQSEYLYTVGGRIKLHRVMGKTSFAHIGDEGGALQLYLKRANSAEEEGVPAEQYDAFKKFDLGDIIGVSGVPYRTNKGELSLKVYQIRLLTKSLLPLPDKHHGLADREMCCRQRYLDLMVNPDSMETFKKRSQIVSNIRRFMELSDFVEVETPMMHSIPGGATAKPFITHHNSLDVDLYLRIAPELHLKRLIVGGFNRVFEINRNFRNEGLSPRHNPEFSMMEFYATYWDYHDLIEHTKNLLTHICQNVLNTHQITYGDVVIDLSNITTLTMEDAVKAYVFKGIPTLDSWDTLKQWWSTNLDQKMPVTRGEAIAFLFEEFVEHQLIQPTFITEFPIEISPLARRNDQNPNLADRFELFIAGQEIANGFSELNDPDDQAARFREQARSKESGNDEAMHYDEDYVTALQYGMPPTAGEGIGIDRLVAILLNKQNIRDVILFPQMRPLDVK